MLYWRLNFGIAVARSLNNLLIISSVFHLGL